MRVRMRVGTLLLIAFAPVLGLAGAARAQSAAVLSRNPQCQHIATVQFLDCELTQIFSCPQEAGLPGPYFRDEIYGAQGLFLVALSNADGWEFAEADPQGTFAMLFDPAKTKGTKVAELTASGKGSLHAEGEVVSAQGRGNVTMDVSVKVTGNKTTLNGVEFDEVRVTSASDFPPPIGASNAVSKAYLVPKLGYSVEGEAISGTNFDPNAEPHRPMSIALPGTPEFVTTKPAFCSANLG